jgi:hypothetical protein
MRIGALFADLRIRGIFGAHEDVYFDFRVFDADASSVATSDLRTILNRNEAEKLRKYRPACHSMGAKFMPFVITAAEGIPSSQATVLLNLLADGLASKWRTNKASLRSWLHTRLAFAVIRGSSLCIRSKRYHWNRTGLFHYDWNETRGPF